MTLELGKKEISTVYSEIKKIMLAARQEVYQTVNTSLIKAYWEIGRKIIEDEQSHQDRAEYGKNLIEGLSKELTKEFGRGFSRSNLQNMRNFYLSYPICQTVSGKLTWSHYCESNGSNKKIG